MRWPFTPNPDWYNRPLFNPRGREPHVESFFFKANDPESQRALWVRMTLFGGDTGRYGETWAILFDAQSGQHRAAKNHWDLGEVNVDPSRAGVSIGSCLAEDGVGEGRTRGVVTADDFSLAWEMRLVDELGPYRHFPADWMYKSRIAGTKITSPHPCARVSGKVEVQPGPNQEGDSQVLSLDGWRGMQGHNWGRRHTERYAWSHCNAFAEETAGNSSFFEGFYAHARLAGLPRTVSMSRLVVNGTVYRFDTFKNLRGSRGEVTPTGWRFEMHGPDGRISGSLVGNKQDTVGLVYANPSGPPAHCLNSKLAELTLTLDPKHGERLRLHSQKAALEVAQLDTNHGITMVL